MNIKHIKDENLKFEEYLNDQIKNIKDDLKNAKETGCNEMIFTASNQLAVYTSVLNHHKNISKQIQNECRCNEEHTNPCEHNEKNSAIGSNQKIESQIKELKSYMPKDNGLNDKDIDAFNSAIEALKYIQRNGKKIKNLIAGEWKYRTVLIQETPDISDDYVEVNQLYCTACGETEVYNHKSKYCPNCGAKMK